MRIVDRETFLKLPAGTVFAKAETPPTLDFGPLEIKGDTCAGVDFYVQRLLGDFEGDNDSLDWSETYERVVAGGTAKVDYNIEGRDGLFDQGQLFAVLEAEDVAALIARLRQAQRDAYSPT